MKKIFTLLFFITLAIGLTGCKPKEDEEVLHIGLMKSLLSVPYYYAEENGIFEKYGIDVKLELYNSAKDRDASFQGNKINAVSTDLVAALLYLNSGKEIVITSQTEEEFRLVTNKDYTADSINEIEKAKIGVSENTVVEFLVDHIMAENNIKYVKQGDYDNSTESKIYTKKPVPVVPDRFSAVMQGTVDMAIMPEPFPSLVISNEGKELWSNTDTNLYATCFVVDKAFAEDNYKIIKNMNLAINEAIKEMMEGDFEDYKDIIIDPKHTLIPESNIDLISEQEFHPLENPNEDTFKEVLAWVKQKNLVSGDYELKDILYPYQLDNLSHQ